MTKNKTIKVKDTTITIIHQNEIEYISLTDMTVGFSEGSGLIGKWITTKNTLEYLAIWETINNQNFNYPEFGVIEKEAGVNRFIMSAGQWINRTTAIGLIVKVFIHQGLSQNERIKQLNIIAIKQMKSLLNNKQLKGLSL